MSDKDNRDAGQCPQPERERLAKLRALGRQMELRERVEALRRELLAGEQEHQLERDALNSQLESERRTASDRERELNERLEESRTKLQSILNSRSWKITRPLRDVTEWLGGRRNKNPHQDVNSSAPSVHAPFAPAVDHPLKTSAESLDTTEQAATILQAEPASTQNPAKSEIEPFVTGGKNAWDEAGTRRLRELLSSDGRMTFPKTGQPTVSIIIALLNKAHLTILCLDSLLRNATNYELILVDNGSTDETGQLLDRLDGVSIVRNAENRGFGDACMQGAERAAGGYLCFLNNDLVLCPGTLQAATANFRENEDVGAVGGKLLLSDGRLQEAGSIVWRDGTAWGYGRGGDPASRKYAFRRPVDYCSGALLFTPRALFNELGGFDAQFLPAYYEDTDYCFKVWDRGRSVVYEPNAMAHHYESASMLASNAAKTLIDTHRARFVEKWKNKLRTQLPLSGGRIPYARFAMQARGARILYMCGGSPEGELGSDVPQTYEFITRLVSGGHHVTCVSSSSSLESREYPDISRDVELADAQDAHYVFRELLSQYDVVWVAGSESMRELLRHMWDMDERVPPIVYETEGAAVEGSVASWPSNDADTAQLLGEEVALCQAADIVIVPTEPERQSLLTHRVSRVEVLSQDTANRILSEIATESTANSY